MGPLGRFLLALGNMVRTGGIKKIEDAFNMAKQEFGEVTPLLKKQIERIFARGKKQEPGAKKEGEVIEASFKPGKSKYSDKIIEESPSQKEGITFSVPERGIFNQKTSIDEVTQMLTKNPFRPGGPLDQVTGITRGLARKILSRKGIEIGKKDPIDVFTDTFGESITDVKNLAEEMVEAEKTGRKLKSADELLEIEGLYDIEIPKNPNKGLTDEEMLKKMEEIEQEDILKKFDPKDREPNAMGGINRTSYAIGSGIKLAGFLAIRGKTLKDEIKKAINRFMQPSGDNKLDADVILDDMFDELGVDRDMFDQKDVMDVYGEIYDNLTANTATAEFLRPKGGDLVSKQLKTMRLAEDIKPGLFENLTDKQRDIIDKYGDLVDRDLLKNIVLDPNPNNQADAIATLEQVKTMGDKGMSTDEIMSVLQSTPRRKQAEGGLNYLMGM